MESLVILLIFIQFISLSYGRICSPAKFNSDVADMYFAGNAQEGADQAIFSYRGKLVYDYLEKRWAFDRFDIRNASNNLRIVVDHGKDRMFVKTETYCVVSPVGDVKMYPACLPDNATNHGPYSYATGEHKINFDYYSYDLMGFPVRFLFKVNAMDSSFMQDTSFGTVPNNYLIYEGESPCIPWEYPTRAKTGDCWKSHFKKQRSIFGSTLTGQLANLRYTNTKYGIKGVEDFFDLPDGCEVVEEWAFEIKKGKWKMDCSD
ncbi:DgyrCDS7839 [Dimorphilus gyrociliatus]|uniref:DgyrCDS7839 n=1 Tax=Dimorphilus gyrociliatus TaxID=2664684 RepID=A0A7I8VU15_9ANNE|nr:DgyrCDS7839 [Dimorphilus gyrociliatus]